MHKYMQFERARFRLEVPQESQVITVSKRQGLCIVIMVV